MAESAAFSLASKILSTIASPAFEMAYEKGVSIWEAKDELAKLQKTMVTIQAVLLDAEKKQEGSAAVKDWIKRVKGVLYDAEDLFDEVTTEDLLKQQMMEEGSDKLSLKKKVRVSFSKLNPIISRNSIAKRVKAIRKDLVDISTDMAQFEFVRCQDEKPILNTGRGENRGCFVDARDVIGRDGDKEAIFEMLINESDKAKSDDLVVIAIVGIGGMGKTTLAQLLYNDENVKKNFDKRWFACISDISDEREVLGKIFQSISGGSNSHLDVGQLQIKIRESIEGKKYLLVLDDVWEDDRGRWRDRMSLLSSRATGSKIIVTTRLPSVAKAVDALVVHTLKGLSEDDSWSLFKNSAFNKENENDPRMKSLGREIIKKCSGVPLAIRSIGSLLFLKNTIREWEAIEKEDLPTLGRNYNDKTMSVLKLSYDHLPSHLKHCFAYCCLFPKDHVFSKKDLIDHWIAQGYIEQNDEESGFMHLLRRGFFQEAQEDKYGEIESCKMHDLMHDLALYVAGEESVDLRSAPLKTRSSARRVSIQISETDGTWDISTLVLNAKSLRSLLLSGTRRYKIENLNLYRLFASVKLLRTLSLSQLAIKNIPASIGELKLLRYLDLSSNSFEELPNSLVYLVNLFSLNLECCSNFEVWPLNFHKLTNLCFVNVKYCRELRLMPIGIGAMTHLQYLGDFKIEEGRGLIASVGFPQQLRGKLSIMFWGDMDENRCSWQLPVSLQVLEMSGYRGMRIPGWGNNGSTNNLARLKLRSCWNVKYLPPLRCLPNLKWLHVDDLEQLEFMEEEDNTCDNVAYKFFPCLEKLILWRLPKLNRWWRNAAGELTSTSSALVEFPLLCQLKVGYCPNLKLESLPLCPHIQKLRLTYDTDLWSTVSCSSTPPSLKEITLSGYKWQSILTSLRELQISNCRGLKSLHLASSPLQRLRIGGCNELKSVELVGAHRLQDTFISRCNKLMSIKLAVAQHVEGIMIRSCKELKSVELVEPQTPTLSLGILEISDCKKMESLHISPRFIGNLKTLEFGKIPKLMLLESVLSSLPALNIGGCSWTVEISLENTGGEFIEQFSSLPIQHVEIKRCNDPIKFPGTSFTSLRYCSIKYVDGLEILHLPSPHLQRLSIEDCRGLTSVEVEAPTSIKIVDCHELKNLRIAHPNALEKLKIFYMISASTSTSTNWNSISNLGSCSCIRDIRLGGVDGVFIERILSSSASSLGFIDISKCRGAISCTGVDWDSLPNLHELCLPPLQPQEELPQCLVQRQAIGKLKLSYDKQSDDAEDLEYLRTLFHHSTLDESLLFV